MAVESKTIRGRLLRWGNSYGIRVRKQDADHMGLRPGEEVSIRLERDKDIKEALARFPLFHGGDRDVSQKHDEYLGKAREARWKRSQRLSEESQ